MLDIDLAVSIKRLSVAFVPLMLGIILHEVAHGWAALKRGDPTAAMLGRLTLNPVPHIDPMGLFVFVLTSLTGPFVFGWAKPVPINPRNFRCQRDQLQLSLTIGNHLLRGIQGYFRPAGFDSLFPNAVQPWPFAVNPHDIRAFIFLVCHFADAADHPHRTGWENAGDTLGSQAFKIMPNGWFLNRRILTDLSRQPISVCPMVMGIENSRNNPLISIIHGAGHPLRVGGKPTQPSILDDHRPRLPLAVPENAFAF